MPVRKVREKRITCEGYLYFAVGNEQQGDIAAGLIMPMGGFVFCPLRGINNPMVRWAVTHANARGVALLVKQPDDQKHWARRKLFEQFPQAAEKICQEAQRQAELDPTDLWLKSFQICECLAQYD